MSLRLDPALCRLTEDVRARLEGLGRVVLEISRAVHGRDPASLSGLEQAGLFHCLQVFYAGVEDILLRIMAEVDRFSFHGAADWSRELLRRMRQDLPRVRPAVLSPELFERLDACRAFTASTRRCAALQVPDAAHLFALVADLSDLYASFAAQVEGLLDYLWRAGECEEREGRGAAGRK